jgi:hypothetical protein
MNPKIFTALIVVVLAAGCASAPPKAASPANNTPPATIMHDDGEMILPVSRTSATTNGTPVFFHPRLTLKGTDFLFVEFSEHGEGLNAESALLDFSLAQTGDHKLQSATITLRPAPQIYKRDPPDGPSAWPITNITSYTDLNGDSILDTMRQSKLKDEKWFILLGNQWIQVQRSRTMRRTDPKQATGLSGEKYEFADSVWRLVPAK